LSSGQRTSAAAKIEVHTYQPQTYDDSDGGTDLVEINVTEAFHGGIEGEGVVRFLQAIRADGSASFVGIERVTGSIGGRSGTFLLQDAGTVQGSVVSGTWFVIPGSGTGDLAGLRGEGGFTANLGEDADVTLDYWFE
jgi:Protein of unknown function (DUF3224)